MRTPYSWMAVGRRRRGPDSLTLVVRKCTVCQRCGAGMREIRRHRELPVRRLTVLLDDMGQ
jgi:hypothetical protein